MKIILQFSAIHYKVQLTKSLIKNKSKMSSSIKLLSFCELETSGKFLSCLTVFAYGTSFVFLFGMAVFRLIFETLFHPVMQRTTWYEDLMTSK